MRFNWNVITFWGLGIIIGFLAGGTLTSALIGLAVPMGFSFIIGLLT